MAKVSTTASAAVKQTELPAGEILLNRYRVIRTLGHGGVGVVYLAEHCQTTQLVAIKVLTPEGLADPMARGRMLREAQAIARLRSDYVVAVHDFEDHPDLGPVLVMEYIDGQSVLDLIRRGPIPFARVRALGEQMLIGLEAVHAQGIVHRDLKPGNLIIEPLAGGEERCKIIDFGIARPCRNNALSLTAAGQMVGTPSFMAPEQIDGSPSDITPQTDLYAATVSLFSMLTRRRPFGGTEPMQMILAVLEDTPRTLSNAAGVPFCDALEAFVKKGLARDRRARFESAAVMRREWLLACDAEEAFRSGVKSTVADVPPPESRDTRPDGIHRAKADTTLSRAANARFRAGAFARPAVRDEHRVAAEFNDASSVVRISRAQEPPPFDSLKPSAVVTARLASMPGDRPTLKEQYIDVPLRRWPSARNIAAMVGGAAIAALAVGIAFRGASTSAAGAATATSAHTTAGQAPAVQTASTAPQRPRDTTSAAAPAGTPAPVETPAAIASTPAAPVAAAVAAPAPVVTPEGAPVGTQDPSLRPTATSEAQAIDRADYEVLVREGRTLADRGQFARARRLLTTALGIRRDDPAVHLALGFVELDAGYPTTAASYFRRALAIDPNASVGLFGLGEVYGDQNDTRQAIAYYRRYLAQERTGPYADRARNALRLLDAGATPASRIAASVVARPSVPRVAD